jgi:inward rectifier potassium channel
MAERRRPKTVFGGSVLQKNQPRKGRLTDLYYWLVTTGRGNFAATILGCYLGVNLLFALAYLLVGGIDNARPGSFADAFFFSVQTMATIGYGRMVPLSLPANLLVTIEAGLGLFGIALAASLMFARFTRATAGVRFSRNAVITRFDGKPTLMFRLANERLARINEARVHIVAARQKLTAEGQEYRRLVDLEPLRSFSPVFELSWTVLHVIDEKSPLWGCTPESLASSDTAVTIVFSGHHEGFQQPVHARHTYGADQLAWDHRFADMIERDVNGSVVIDYARFDEILPMQATECLIKP